MGEDRATLNEIAVVFSTDRTNATNVRGDQFCSEERKGTVQINCYHFQFQVARIARSVSTPRHISISHCDQGPIGPRWNSGRDRRGPWQVFRVVLCGLRFAGECGRLF